MAHGHDQPRRCLLAGSLRTTVILPPIHVAAGGPLVRGAFCSKGEAPPPQ